MGPSLLSGVYVAEASPHATVLVVGARQAGKKSFSRALVAEKGSLKLQVRMSAVFPPPHDPSRPPVDFVALVVDLTNMRSAIAARETLMVLDPLYLTGRTVIIASKVDSPQMYAFTPEDLETVAEQFDVPLYYANLKSPADSARVAARVASLLHTLRARHDGTSVPLLRTLDVDSVLQTGPEVDEVPIDTQE